MNRTVNTFWPFLILFICFLSLPWASPAWAGKNDIDISSLLASDFKNFSKEAGLAISYFPLSPAEPLGITGFDIGVEVTAVNIDQGASFWTNSINNPPDFLIFPKLHIQKGLPWKIDLGIIYSKVPDSNISLIGGELKWALLKGSMVTPAVAIRGSYTRLLGVSQLKLETYGVDISISKGIAFLTPYGGLGEIWINSEETAGIGLGKARINETKFFGGVKATFLLFSLVAEVSYADILSYSLRANIGF